MIELFGMTLPMLLTIAGVALCAAEALAPGTHFIVVGVAVLTAGLLGLALGQAATPIVLAAFVLVSGGTSLYAYRNLDLYGGTGAGQTKDSGSLVGAQGEVVEAITQTDGRVRLYDAGGFDPVYSARSIDGEIEAGEEIMVVDPGGGSVLTVETLRGMDEIDRELARESEPTDPAGSGASPEDSEPASAGDPPAETSRAGDHTEHQ